MTDDFEFAKMHGAGNDFIMVSDMDNAFEESVEVIRSLCERHRGVGADGMILIRPSRVSDFSMDYFNRDGSRAEMCGNGARCAALFANERGIAGRTMTFDTGSGPVDAEILEEGVRISIGHVTGVRLGIEVGRGMTAGFALSGVPHAAISVLDVGAIDREKFLSDASYIRHSGIFAPAGANVNFVTVLSRHKLAYRTYERGVEEETLACGTGAVGVSVIMAHSGVVSSPVECETSGGDILKVGFELSEGGATHCTLTGPAKTAFCGTAKKSDYIRD